jgi:hypothetical protein
VRHSERMTDHPPDELDGPRGPCDLDGRPRASRVPARPRARHVRRSDPTTRTTGPSLTPGRSATSSNKARFAPFLRQFREALERLGSRRGLWGFTRRVRRVLCEGSDRHNQYVLTRVSCGQASGSREQLHQVLVASALRPGLGLSAPPARRSPLLRTSSAPSQTAPHGRARTTARR